MTESNGFTLGEPTAERRSGMLEHITTLASGWILHGMHLESLYAGASAEALMSVCDRIDKLVAANFSTLHLTSSEIAGVVSDAGTRAGVIHRAMNQ